MKKGTWLLIFLMLVSLGASPAKAASGIKEGASSLLIPGWGQYQNGEFETRNGKIKSSAMIVIEVAAIVTTAVVGGTAGAPAVWAGIGIFIANHVWSGLDAFINAEKEPGVALGTASKHDTVDAK